MSMRRFDWRLGMRLGKTQELLRLNQAAAHTRLLDESARFVF